MGVPYLTLDPATGLPVAVFGDGVVVPLRITPAPAMVAPGQEGITDAGTGTQGSGGTGAAPGLGFGIQPGSGVPGWDGAAGGDGAAGSGGGGPAGGGGFFDAGGGGYAGIPAPPDVGRGSAAELLFGALGADGGGEVRLRQPVVPVDYGPPPRDWGGEGQAGGTGGGGGLPSAAARLAAARARIQSALGAAGIGGGYGTGSSYGTDVGRERRDALHGRWSHGMDPGQAAGLTSRPTAMLPRVFPGLTPADPTYGNLSAIPAGKMALLLGRGTPGSTANTIGQIYHRAGTTGGLPSTDTLLQGFTRGRGIEEMFQGVRAGRHDAASPIAPGYVYGQEPMPLGEAAPAAGGLLDAALYGEPLAVQAKYGAQPGGWGSFLIDKWASRAVKRPAGRGVPVYRYVGRRLTR